MNKTLDIFLTFLKIGVITFGGGYAMISLVDEEIVAKKKWLDEEEFTSICGIAESTPGPISINLATYIGYKQNKLLGSILATLGVVLPSLLIIFGISLIFNQFLANEYVAKAFIGIKCAVSYLIIKAGLNMFMKSDKRIIDYILLVLCIAFLVINTIFILNISSIFLILFGALVGLIIQVIKK